MKRGYIMINIENTERIMNDYMPLIYATIRRFNAFEKEEAIDEAKMVLIEAILSYDESQGTFGNYLKHRLNYHFWDKSKKPLPTSLDQDYGDDLSLIDTLKSEDDIEDEFFTKEAYKDLYDKIKTLDKKDVLIIKLKYWQGLSDKKIAQLLYLSPKTIRNRHSLAIKKLRKMYS